MVGRAHVFPCNFTKQSKLSKVWSDPGLFVKLKLNLKLRQIAPKLAGREGFPKVKLFRPIYPRTGFNPFWGRGLRTSAEKIQNYLRVLESCESRFLDEWVILHSMFINQRSCLSGFDEKQGHLKREWHRSSTIIVQCGRFSLPPSPMVKIEARPRWIMVSGR